MSGTWGEGRRIGGIPQEAEPGRGKLLSVLASQPRCVVAMEACASAHDWGREIMTLGHERYAPEFKARMVELVRAGRSPDRLAKEFEPSATAIRRWVEQADWDEGLRNDGLTTAERKEVRELKRELRRGDARPSGNAKALAGGDGAGAPAPAGPAGESALRGGASDRARGRRTLPERPEGSEDRAEVAARSSWSTRQYQVHYDPRVEDWRVRAYAEQERMDQVREVDGEEAYQKRKRAWRGQASLWCPRGSRRTIGRSAVGRNAADQRGTLAPAVERL